MHKRSSLAATLHRSTESHGLRVELGIDGKCLIALLREAEAPHARREGAEALAGNYGWPLLTPRWLRLLAGEATDGVLLNCACGLPDCWPLAMTIRLQGRFVVWESFRHLRRPGLWNYRGLQPVRFLRAAYFQEVSKLQAAYKQSTRFATRAVLKSRDFAGPCAL